MTLTVNEDRTIITVVSTLLTDFVGNEGDYTNIIIQIYFNSTTNSTSETYDEDNLITSVTNVFDNSGTNGINPAFFDATEFAQGVYHIIITLTSEASIQTDEGCIFVEEDLGCDLDEYLLDENRPILERVLAGEKYKRLLAAQDCACKCDKKITIYNSLVDIQNSCQSC